MNQADQSVGGDFGRNSLDIGPLGRIGPIARICELSNLLRLWMILLPKRQLALPQKVLIVEQQLFQAGAGHADQFQFEFFGCAGGHAAFGNVLLAAAGGLHHLIMGAGTATDPAITKYYGSVINDFRHLV